MTEMSMNRAIHGAVRRDLDHLRGALEHFPHGDPARAGRLGEAWRHLADQLHEHHTGEHAIAWPAMQALGVGPDLLAQLDSEHAVMVAAITGVDDAMQTLAQDPSQAHAGTALAAVTHLDTVTKDHLQHEEAELEPVYLRNQDTPQLKAMNKQFRNGGPAKGGQLFAWVADGASAEEQAALRHSVPAPVLMVLTGIFGRDYRKRIATVWTE